MFSRFRDSIVTPAKIVDFRNDKAIWVILYVLFFAMLLSTRMIIDVITYDGLPIAEQNEIIDNLPELNDTCGFDATSYTCDTEETTLVYQNVLMSYYLDSHDSLQYDDYETQYNIVIQGDTMFFIFANNVMYEEPLTNVSSDLLNLDFALQSSNPDLFEERILSSIDSYILGYKPIWGPMIVLADIITAMFLFFSFVLLSAWMLRFRFKPVPFKQLFVMTGYSSTAMYLILIFNSLFNLSFFLVIILIFIAFRQNNQLSMEIIKRLNQRKP
jgi:hypothetical protein